MEVHPSIPREGLQNIDTHIYVLRFNQQIGVIKILEINFFFFMGRTGLKEPQAGDASIQLHGAGVSTSAHS